MSVKPDAPRSIGGVLDIAMRLYGRSILPCMPLVILGTLFMGIPSLMVSRNLSSAASDPAAMLAMWASPLLPVSYLLLICVSIVVYGALFAQLDALARGDRLKAMSALLTGLRRFPVLLGVSILFGMMVLIGGMLLLISGIYLWGVFQFAALPPILERAGVFESLSTSARLVRGNWWRASAIMMVSVFIVLALFMMVFLVAGVLSALFVLRSTRAGTPPDLATAQMISMGLSLVTNLFTLTFFPSVMLATYYDLKLRNEGADLATRVDALNAPT